MVIKLTVGVFAAYAAKQADNFFLSERRNRRIALQLAAIDPHIALLPEKEQHDFKIEIGRTAFGREELPSSGADKSPTSALDVVGGTKTAQQFIDLLSKIVDKVPKVQ
jgi:hypothetical protein